MERIIMTEELKERFDLWLSYCLTLDKFKNQYKRMLSEMRPVNVEKLKKFEEINESKTKNGKYYHNNLMIRDYNNHNEELCMTLQRSDNEYIFRLVNRDLSDLPVMMFNLNMLGVDRDYVATLEVNNDKTQQYHTYEVVASMRDNKPCLIYREWTWVDGHRWSVVDTQTKPLTEQQVNKLLRQNNIKQL